MKKLLLFLIFVTLFIFLYLGGYTQALSLTNIQGHKIEIVNFTQEHPFQLAFLSLFLFIVISNFHIIFGGLLLLLLLGALFGPLVGSLIGILSSFAGAASSFCVSRYFFHDFFQKKYAKKLDQLNNHLKHSGFWYLLFLRFTPGVPQQTLHVVAGSSKITAVDFLAATLIGAIPSCIIYCSVGNIIWDLTALQNIVALRNVMVIYALFLLFFLPIIFYKIRCNHNNRINLK